MAKFRYHYAADDPPVPSVLLNVAHPIVPNSLANLPAIVDTGADQTVFPTPRVSELDLPRLNQQLVTTYDGTPDILPTYLIRLQVRDFPPFELVVIASDGVKNVVLGRDVLNRYKIVLDGPRQMLEISDDPA